MYLVSAHQKYMVLHEPGQRTLKVCYYPCAGLSYRFFDIIMLFEDDIPETRNVKKIAIHSDGIVLLNENNELYFFSLFEDKLGNPTILKQTVGKLIAYKVIDISVANEQVLFLSMDMGLVLFKASECFEVISQRNFPWPNAGEDVTSCKILDFSTSEYFGVSVVSQVYIGMERRVLSIKITPGMHQKIEPGSRLMRGFSLVNEASVPKAPVFLPTLTSTLGSLRLGAGSSKVTDPFVATVNPSLPRKESVPAMAFTSSAQSTAQPIADARFCTLLVAPHYGNSIFVSEYDTDNIAILTNTGYFLLFNKKQLEINNLVPMEQRVLKMQMFAPEEKISKVVASKNEFYVVLTNSRLLCIHPQASSVLWQLPAEIFHSGDLMLLDNTYHLYAIPSYNPHRIGHFTIDNICEMINSRDAVDIPHSSFNRDINGFWLVFYSLLSRAVMSNREGFLLLPKPDLATQEMDLVAQIFTAFQFVFHNLIHPEEAKDKKDKKDKMPIEIIDLALSHMVSTNDIERSCIEISKCLLIIMREWAPSEKKSKRWVVELNNLYQQEQQFYNSPYVELDEGFAVAIRGARLTPEERARFAAYRAQITMQAAGTDPAE